MQHQWDKMRKIGYKALLVLLVFIFFIPPGGVKAQSTPPSEPVYIVQEGDTLWDIANRFHVSQSALARANGIIDANDISIGKQLLIPGLEGISGILTTQNIPYGENLGSLSYRYGITPQALMRLNHVTSPNEFFAGYSLVIPQQETPPPLGKRESIHTGQSLMELAILNDTDAWSIISKNGLENSAASVPGAVLRVAGDAEDGPGALPPEITSINLTGLTQGQTAEIKVDAHPGLSMNGSLMDHPLNFFPDPSVGYVALQGVHAMAEPGLYPLALQVSAPDGLQFNYSQMVLVQAGDFVYDRSLPVDPATLDPETNRTENELWYTSAAAVTPERLWNGPLAFPVDPAFAGCFSSRFGSRRSYNNGAYDFFHTGLDFCGQVGDPVYAAASGIVVFTGQLTVRGNATMIDHGWGVYTAYMHQSEILVNHGDHVEKGQLIGRVGNTGRVEGPHLHFEVLVGDVQVDPLAWLNGEFP